ncbi:MAG: helix-turn-helix domain-containing protein [Dehalococcoidia bacterium]
MDDNRLTFTVGEAAALAGISPRSAYGLIRLGKFPSIRLGHRLVVPRAALLRLLDGETETAGATRSQGAPG